jgi:Fe-S-cluster-containing dehydrogenase component
MACINEKNTDVDVKKPYRELKRNEYQDGENLEITWFVHGCMHCPEHPCANTCPKKCFSFDRATGIVSLDNRGCVGCHMCERSCPFGAVQFVGKKADKCDGCLQRLKMDMLPMCVMACPRGALTVTEKNQVVTDGLEALKQELKTFKSREDSHE